jgi:cytochrome d ubiquinol oxidase subunit II
MASIITPVLLGMALGAVSSGGLRVIDSQIKVAGTPPWLLPIAFAIGALALAICAYLAAVYLTIETGGALQADFRRRALIAGTFVVGLSIITLPLLRLETPHLWTGLISRRAAPRIAAGVAAALLSGWALLFHRFHLARIASVAQVVFLLAGWGLAQHPYIIYPDITLQNAAAPAATLRFVLVTRPFGLGLLAPSLWLLFSVFKRPQREATDHPGPAVETRQSKSRRSRMVSR